MGRIVLTSYKNKIITCHFNDERVLENVNACPIEGGLLGSIYRAHVSNVVKNLEACFVNITPEITCFLPFKEIVGDIPKQGDEVTVMVTKEAVKTKGPSVSMNLSLTGKYMVISSADKCSIGISKKISEADTRNALHKLFGELAEGEPFSIVVRTAAVDLDMQAISDEFVSLKEKLEKIINYSSARTVYSCLYCPKPGYISFLRTLVSQNITEITTDIKTVYDQILEEFGNNNCSWDSLNPSGELSPEIKLYDDTKVSLYNLLSLGARLDEITNKKVYLRCGGYLIIEQTEALNVIDVNSGKLVDKKDRDKAYEIVNKEAACEIARQLRLRNLSGIIIIDFINVKKEEARELLDYFALQLKGDNAKPQIVDITALSLVEVTRKRTTPSLAEQLL